MADLLTYKHSPLLIIKELAVKKPEANALELHDAYTLFLMDLTGRFMMLHLVAWSCLILQVKWS